MMPPVIVTSAVGVGIILRDSFDASSQPASLATEKGDRAIAGMFFIFLLAMCIKLESAILLPGRPSVTIQARAPSADRDNCAMSGC